MTQLSRLAFIGNSLPRHCGIATFTNDLQQAVAKSRTNIETSIIAMTDHDNVYKYPPVVRFHINDRQVEDYARAARVLNAERFEVVSLQHEFGIFGGDNGGHIVPLLAQLNMPIVTTLHTVLAEPREGQCATLNQIIRMSSKVVVMAEKGQQLLRTVYHAPADKIVVIPHGIPSFPFVEPDRAKAKLGFGNRAVILTFGLLSPNKGIEVMIDAMPSILERRPDAVYVVLGATHPNLVREQGEAYRHSLIARVQELGIEDHVIFLDRFVDQPTLLDFISMCDVYVTPYLNESQMTSGTLAYSFGLGKAVVSTPYWHARELLADGRGVLVPFGDSVTIGRKIADLLTDDARRQSMRERAYATSRSMTWERVAEDYLTVFDGAKRGSKLRTVLPSTQGIRTFENYTPPDLQIGHLVAMSDDTGLLQHAVLSVPDRAHGYCVDDNARALLLACTLNCADEAPLPEALTDRFAAFIQHAWNPDTRRFRNFMSFDRRWLEASGSEDSHGRTLWALGECARADSSPMRRRWAAALFAEALPTAEGFCSPRAWAFTLLGLHAYCAAGVRDDHAASVQHRLAEKLMALLAETGTEEWMWFEDGLSYDNARLSQALIVTGTSTATPAYVEAGLRTLRWLMPLQTAPAGFFRPVGTQGFGDRRQLPKAFDQQPLEATATISACLAAHEADGDPQWKASAKRVFTWFLGGNDLSTALVDVRTGSCRDGLHQDRPNENRGAESVLSYLLSLVEIRQMARARAERSTLLPVRALSTSVV
jgi:glycosyltransferase involved in cell wall biosynthesis